MKQKSFFFQRSQASTGMGGAWFRIGRRADRFGRVTSAFIVQISFNALLDCFCVRIFGRIIGDIYSVFEFDIKMVI